MSLRGIALACACCLALGSAGAQSALTPPKPVTLRRPAINSQDVGQTMLADSLRVRPTRLVLRRLYAAARPAPRRLARPRIPAAVTRRFVAIDTSAPAVAPANPAPIARQPTPAAAKAQPPRDTASTVRRATTVAAPPPAAPASVAAERPAKAATGVAWARVTYLSGASVYLDAGTKHGLTVGTQLEVVRGTSLVAQLVVEYVSSNRASSRVSKSTLPVAIGDSARYEAAAMAEQVIAARITPGSASASRSSQRSQPRPIRGRVGIRYLRSDPGLGPASVLIRPAFDIRADGHNMNGSPFGLTIDVRAYRDRRASDSSSSGSTRVYQGALEFSPLRSGARVTLGRQFSTTLTPIGIFDGAAVDVDRGRWSVGALAGSQPEPVSFGLSGDIREYGAYVQLHNAKNVAPVWSATLGGIGSYANGEIDREFAYVQTSFMSPRFSWYASQEVDVNRGWKSEAESTTVVPTATFAMMRVALTEGLQLNMGYDNRRTVRLYRDFLTPEIEFDDSFRRGAWGGASLSALGHLRISADARHSSGGPAGSSQSYTGLLSVTRLTRLAVGVRGRGTTYNGTISRGSLASASLELTPFGLLHLEGTIGQRRDRALADSVGRPATQWHELTGDFGLGRSVYILVSAYRETGLTRNSQAYVALSYRF